METGKNGTFEKFGGTEDSRENMKTRERCRDFLEILENHDIREKQDIGKILSYLAIRGYQHIQENRASEKIGGARKFWIFMIS